MALDYTPQLKVETNGHIAVMTLDNPKANTFTEESLSAIPKIIKELEENREIYSLVITGKGRKFFSAGADLKVFADGNKDTAAKMAKVFGEAFEAITKFRGLSVAAINGYAMGGGLECALACDLRVAEEQAIMALPEAKVGLLPCAGGTQNLAHLVGEGWAKRMILCGEQVDARTAKEINLVEAVTANGGALEKAMEIAKSVETQSPSSVAACKKLVQHARSAPLWQGLAKERDLFVALFDTEDQTEGVNAFLEKRQAQWKNA